MSICKTLTCWAADDDNTFEPGLSRRPVKDQMRFCKGKGVQGQAGRYERAKDDIAEVAVQSAIVRLSFGKKYAESGIGRTLDRNR